MRTHAPTVTIRKLLAILLALAMLAGSGVTSAAMAATAHHDMAAAPKAGHCQRASSPVDRHDKMAGKNCCVAMCMVVAIAPAAAELEDHGRSAQNGFFLPRKPDGYVGEIATPPPRRS